jgi:NAD(P)H-hydrate epimerase
MFFSREEVRRVDRRAIEEYGVPGVVLMENAGRGSAELLRRLGIHGRVAVCCGKGNNGGDGFVLARHLDNHHIPIKVLLFADPDELSGDAAVHYRILTHSELPIRIHSTTSLNHDAVRSDLVGAEWIVDALFGTGLAGAVRPPFAALIDLINTCAARVLAVDIPSGLDCDTGQPLGPTIRAEHTATFVALKKGFTNPAAREWLGQVHVLDIGAPRRLLEAPSATG